MLTAMRLLDPQPGEVLYRVPAVYGPEDLVDVIPPDNPMCNDVSKAAHESGEDRIDILGGCVLGAVKAGDLKRAGEILRLAKATPNEKSVIYEKIVLNWDVATAEKVKQYAQPKIKTWHWVAGAGFAVVATGLLLATVILRTREEEPTTTIGSYRRLARRY